MASRDYGRWWQRDEHLRDAWLSGFGGDAPDRDELNEYGIASLADLKDAFQRAFIDLDIASDDRAYWREVWFDWMDTYGLDITDFDWDSWREWYDNTA